MSKKGDYKIPWNDKEPMYFTQTWYSREGEKWIKNEPIWKDNIPFEDTLKFLDYGRGRSAAYFHFQSESSGIIYTMFISDFSKSVPSLKEGVLSGWFKFCKKGANYGIQYLGEQKL